MIIKYIIQKLIDLAKFKFTVVLFQFKWSGIVLKSMVTIVN